MLSYETCKKLKENGFQQETFLSYDSRNIFTPILTKMSDKTFYAGGVNIYTFACPSFEEIWEQLPLQIKGFQKELISSYIQYSKEEADIEYLEIKDNNITEAAANLWLLLKKEGLI